MVGASPPPLERSSPMTSGSPFQSRRAPRSPLPLRHLSELLAVGERAELLQPLALDLPDPLARDLEGAPDLVERARRPAVQPVPKLEHLTLALRERGQALLERRDAERRIG